jgi:hypothetical protein
MDHMVFVAKLKVDRGISNCVLTKKRPEISKEEYEEMNGIINECCSKLEKFGYVIVEVFEGDEL